MAAAHDDPPVDEVAPGGGMPRWRLLFREWPRVARRSPRVARATWLACLCTCLGLSTWGVMRLGAGAAPVPEIAPPPPGRTLPGRLQHDAPARAVAFSPAGDLLAVGDAEGRVTLWDAATRQRLNSLEGHTGGVFSVAFSHDGRFLASAGGDPGRGDGAAGDAILIREVASGDVVRRLVGHTALVSSLSFSPFGGVLASAGHDRVVRVWDLTGGVATHELVSASAVWSVAFSPDATVLATGERGSIRLWRTDGYREAGTLEGHDDFVCSLSFLDDQRLASGSLDRTIRLWSVLDRRQIRMWTGHDSGVTSLAVHPSDRLLVSAAYDASMRVWDPSQDGPGRVLAGTRSWVSALAFDPHGALAFACGDAVEFRLNLAESVSARR